MIVSFFTKAVACTNRRMCPTLLKHSSQAFSAFDYDRKTSNITLFLRKIITPIMMFSSAARKESFSPRNRLHKSSSILCKQTLFFFSKGIVDSKLIFSTNTNPMCQWRLVKYSKPHNHSRMNYPFNIKKFKKLY